MNRRSFIKRAGALLGIAYTLPTALIPDVPVAVSTGNHFVPISDMNKHFYHSLNGFSDKFIKPAFKKMTDDMDNFMTNEILKEAQNAN